VQSVRSFALVSCVIVLLAVGWFALSHLRWAPQPPTRWARPSAFAWGCSSSRLASAPFGRAAGVRRAAASSGYSSRTADVMRCSAKVWSISVRSSSARRYPPPMDTGRTSRDAAPP
jgi:hypothetical protein